MARVLTVIVEIELMDALFAEFDILGGIADGRLSAEVVDSVSSHAYPGHSSTILKHFNSKGKHVATSHRISDNDGNTPHWHGTDFVLNDVKLIRATSG